MSLDPVTAGIDLVKEIGGSLIKRIWPDPAQQAQAQIELAKLEQSGELAKLVHQSDSLKAILGDMESARDREAKIATAETAPYLNKIITPLLAIGIIAGVFGGMAWLIGIVDADLNPSQKDIIIYVLGALTAMGTQVISYYFGSSKGDAAKDQAMRDLMKKAVE